MKSHELISLAEYISKIMAHYPNKSVEHALNDILSLLENRKNKVHLINKTEKQLHENKKTPRSLKNSISLQHAFVESLRSENETSELLSNLTLGELKKIANEIGIRTSSRQNKDILVMNISKTMERRRIDLTIQDKDKDKDKDKDE